MSARIPQNGTRRPQAILFDWDNTLVDSWATIHDALNFLMRAMDKPEWSMARNPGAGKAQSAREFSNAFRGALGGGARDLP
jgi:phosphoglycolate phosphatase